MKFYGYKVGLSFFPLVFLAGCINDGGDRYPALNKNQLVGCWVMPNPYPGATCVENCYSESGKIYFKTTYPPSQSYPNFFTEEVGFYSLGRGTDVTISRTEKSNVKPDIDTAQYSANFTIIRDTLNDIAANGYMYPYIRSDSLHNCGAHWLLFPKPTDWALP